MSGPGLSILGLHIPIRRKFNNSIARISFIHIWPNLVLYLLTIDFLFEKCLAVAFNTAAQIRYRYASLIWVEHANDRPLRYPYPTMLGCVHEITVDLNWSMHVDETSMRMSMKYRYIKYSIVGRTNCWVLYVAVLEGQESTMSYDRIFIVNSGLKHGKGPLES